MYRRFLALALCLFLAACAKKPVGTWQAYTINNDKPSVGIELVRDNKGLHGAFYVFDPNKPGDFAAAHNFPMTIQSEDDKEIHFTVSFFPYQPDKVVLQLKDPAEGAHFRATMVTVEGKGEPVDFDFARVK